MTEFRSTTQESPAVEPLPVPELPLPLHDALQPVEEGDHVGPSASESPDPTVEPQPAMVGDEAAEKTADTPEKKRKTKKKERKQATPRSTLPAARGIETMFRTSFRVQVDLTALADNKANIMISINGLIIPIMLFAIVPLFEFNPWLLLPSVVLVFSCLVSIVYAVLSARPRVFKNPVTRTSIESGKANILFFGNFAHLSEQEFVHGMTSMMRVTDNVYVSMMRDIYGMGKVLSRKFALLKKAYDVFMFGLIIAIVLYVGAFVAVAMEWTT